MSLCAAIILSAPSLKTASLFHRNIVGSYISFFIPLNLVSWLALGQVGGIFILIFSCLSVVFIVLREGILYYNIYIFLFGASAVAGYKIFLSDVLSRKRLLARIESLDVDNNALLEKIAQRQRDISSTEAMARRYDALRDITEDLSSTLSLEKTADLITERAFEIIGRSDRAILFLIDESKQELSFFSYKQADGLAEVKNKKAGILDRWILKQRKSLIIDDLDNDFRFSIEALGEPEDKEFKSVIGVPIINELKVVGLLRMGSRSKNAYTQDDLRLLNIIADLAAVSITNSILYQKTGQLAITDGLTGLYVQRYFKERLAAETKKAPPKDKKFSILMIDLDHFKSCNDKYGHTAGDLLLVKVAQTIKTVVDSRHLVSRYGGEEFAVFLPDTDKRGAARISEDIRKKVESCDFSIRRDQIKMTVSIGISSFPDDGSSPHSLLKKADENLYKAKRDGRNKIWPASE